MSIVTLQDLRDIVFGINESPSIWIKDVFEENIRMCVSPLDVIVDDDGDIVLTVDCRDLIKKGE